MNRDDRKKLTANELYLNECMSILYTKIRATGFNFFGKDGAELPNNILNVENYLHGTITFGCRKNAMRVQLDGTNFAGTFAINEKGGFLYKVKPIGLEYVCYDRPLNEAIHERKVVRTVGSSADYYRYLACGTFFILLEHYTKDENGITIVTNTKAKRYKDHELIEYVQEQMQKAEELEYGDDEEDDLPMTEDEAMASVESMEELLEAYEIQMPMPSQDLTSADMEEVEAYASDDSYPDICEIDYSLADIIKDKQIDEPYHCDYPEKIEDFDYQEYIRNIKSGDAEEDFQDTIKTQQQEESNQAAQQEQQDEQEIQADIDDDDFNPDYDEDDNDDTESYYDDDEEEFEEEPDEDITANDLYGATDTMITEEGFIDDSNFQVVQNGQIVDGAVKQDTVDISVTGIMDVDREVMTLTDYYGDLSSEVRKMRAIILKRKERVTRKKSGPADSDVSDSGKKDDKNIE